MLGSWGACQCQCRRADTNLCILLRCGESPLQDLVCPSWCLQSCGICRNQARGQAVCYRASFQQMASRPDAPTFASHVRPSKPLIGMYLQAFRRESWEFPRLDSCSWPQEVTWCSHVNRTETCKVANDEVRPFTVLTPDWERVLPAIMSKKIGVWSMLMTKLLTTIDCSYVWQR